MEIINHSLPESTAQAVLGQIAPGGILDAVNPVGGDFANRGFYIDAHSTGGEPLCLVVKLYQGEYQYCMRRARVEYKTLGWLHLYKRSAPEPLLLDEFGSLLGGPGIITRFMPGKPVTSPPYPEDWGMKMAQTLANIHAYLVDPAAKEFLLAANQEALWFKRSGNIPAWLAADPDGELIWKKLDDLLPNAEKTTPKLIHLDFWGGNVLVHDDKITAVVDWEEASYGDPGVDVAYCLMNLVLCGLDHEAEVFLSTYEALTGISVANLSIWKLAAAARPIFNWGDYIDFSPGRERFRTFVQEALKS